MSRFSQLGEGQATEGRCCPLGDGVRQPPETAKPQDPRPPPTGTLKVRPATKALGYAPGANLAIPGAAVPTGRCGHQTGLSLGTRTPGLAAHQQQLSESKQT